MAKGGSNAIPQLQALLKNPDLDVRIEAVKSIVDIGTQRSLDPLIEATRDSDAEVQIRATDGLVNFYLPGYVRTGLGAKLQRVGKGIKGKFTDTNDQVIEAYIQVRPEVIAALGVVASFAAYLTFLRSRRFYLYVVPAALAVLAKPTAAIFASRYPVTSTP